MKIWKKGIIALLIISMVTSSMAYISMQKKTSTSDLLEAEAAIQDTEGNITFSSADSSQAMGTEANPLVVLEVVPYEGDSEFGYLIQGQEPVNLNDLSIAAALEPGGSEDLFLQDMVAKDYFEVTTPENVPDYKLFKDQIDENDGYDWYTTAGQEADRLGFYERVADTTGNYKLNLEYSEPSYINVGDGNGDYTLVEIPGSTVYKSVYGYTYANKTNFETGLTPEYFVAFTYNPASSAQKYSPVESTNDITHSGRNYYYNFLDSDGQRYTGYNFSNDLYYRYYTLNNGVYSFSGSFHDASWFLFWLINGWYFDSNNTDNYDNRYYTAASIYRPVFFYPDNNGSYVVNSNYTKTLNDDEITTNSSQYSMMQLAYYDQTVTAASYEYQYVGSGNGDYIEKVTITNASFEEYSSGSKEGYNWVWKWNNASVRPGGDIAIEEQDYSKNSIGDKIYEVRSEAYYVALSTNTYTNTNSFLKNSVGLKYQKDSAGGIRYGYLDTTKYSFTGWYTDAECTAAYDFSKPVYSDLTLYANWQETPNYSATFHSNAGTDSVTSMPQNQTQLSVGSKVSQPSTTPLRDGYLFGGWYTDAAGTVLYDFTSDVLSDVTLYAKWFSLNLNANAGTDTVYNMPSGIDEINTVIPIRDSYVFTGWYTDNLYTALYSGSYEASSDVSLYAGWIKCEFGTEDTLDNIPRTIENIQKLLVFRSGYSFAGWYTDATLTTKIQTSDLRAGASIYAGWSLIVAGASQTLTIHFASDLAASDMPADLTNVYYNGEYESGGVNAGRLSEPSEPTCPGYMFSGWYVDDTFKNLFVFGDPIDPTSTVSEDSGRALLLYARWISNETPTADIQFIGNKPSGVTESVSGLPSEMSDLLLSGTEYLTGLSVVEPTDPTLTGYLFTGWYTDAAATSEYIFGTAISEDYLTNGVMTLYAGWVSETAEFTITFLPNRPSSALVGNDVTFTGSAAVISAAGNIVDEGNAPEVRLKSNVQFKIDNYHISVISVTPEELNLAVNYDLIDRANLIIISAGSHFTGDAGLSSSLWINYKNEALFSGKTFDTTYEGESYEQNDLSWEAVLRIYSNVALNDNKATLIYDTAAYTGVTSVTSKNVTVQKTLPDSTVVNYTASASNNNVYKLFIMLNQMDPFTFNQAFLSTGYITSVTRSGLPTTGSFTSADEILSGDAKTYWNSYTFLPYVALDDNDIGTDNEPFEDVWNTWEIENNLSDLFSDGKNFIMNENLFFYQGNTVNLTDYFMVDSSCWHISYNSQTAELYQYFNPETAQEDLSVAEIIPVYDALYYLLYRSQDNDKGYDKDISILEIQPGIVYMPTAYWFWYVRRFIPEYNGIVSIEHQSTAEFIGKIEDLNSEYNLIYMGSYKDGIESYKRVFQTTVTQVTTQEEQWHNAGETVQIKISQNVDTKKEINQWCSAGSNVTLSRDQSVYEVLSEQHYQWDYVTVNIGQYLRYYYYDSRGRLRSREDYFYPGESATLSENQLVDVLASNNKTRNIALTVTYAQNLYIWGRGETYYQIDNDHPYYEITLDYGQNILEYVTREVVETNSVWYSYTHTGAAVENVNTTLRGTLGMDDDEDTYYYSGNDITEAKMQDLLEYAEAGYPVIFSEALYNVGANGSLTTNSSELDTASNMYSFAETLKNAASDSSNKYYGSFFYESQVDHDTFEQALRQTKCELSILSEPVAYQDITLDSTLTDQDIYVNGAIVSNKILTYSFMIEDASDENYQIHLYLDTNADGRFDPANEQLDNLEIYALNGSSRTYISQDSSLKANQIYVVNRDVSTYAGVIPWKLEVVQTDNQLVRDMKIGTSAIKADSSFTREELKILQIIPSGATVYMPTTAEMEALNNVSPAITLSNASSKASAIDAVLTALPNDTSMQLVTTKFWLYMKDLSDFKVSIERISVDSFMALSDPKAFLSNGKYNMLVLGFDDTYQDIKTAAAQEAIEDFIGSGASVLFTHDTTSYRNQDTSAWGFYFNKYFRDIVGMDRYGITLLYPYMGSSYSINNVLNLGRDGLYSTGTSQTVANILRADSVISSGRYLEQGFSDTFVHKMKTNNTTTVYTTYVSKINSGQLTEYPYYIPDDFSISQTHEQYYQLDLEAEDIVVWYTLGDTDENNVQHSNEYTSSPYDVRNNYYIYNRGNITYTGVGHSGTLTDNEVKLFVNTMVASYNSIAQKPGVTILNRDKVQVDDSQYLYIDFDSTDDTKAIGEDIVTKNNTLYKRVYFQIKDSSILVNKTISMEYYEYDPSGTDIKVDDGEDISSTADDVYLTGNSLSENGAALKTYQTLTNEEVDFSVGDRLYAGVSYYVDVPITAMDTMNKYEMFFRIVINYGKDSTKYKYGYQNVTLLRRGLFNLD